MCGFSTHNMLLNAHKLVVLDTIKYLMHIYLEFLTQLIYKLNAK